MTFKYFSETEIKKANKDLGEIVTQIESLTNQATKLADKYGLEFTLEPCYGAGATYYGEGYNEINQTTWKIDEGWNPSSESC